MKDQIFIDHASYPEKNPIQAPLWNSENIDLDLGVDIDLK